MGGRFGKYGDTKRKAKLRQSGDPDRKAKQKIKELDRRRKTRFRTGRLKD